MCNGGGRSSLGNRRSERKRLTALKTALTHPIISSLVVIALVALGGAGWRMLTNPTPVETAETTLRALNVNLSSDMYDKVLGSPIIRRGLGSKGLWTERLWINDLYAVQTVADSNGMVRLYSLTSRDPSLSPRVRILEIPIRSLGFAKGETASGEVGSWGGMGGDFWYSEAHYLGGAGEYKTVVMTASTAGPNPTFGTMEIPQIDGAECATDGPMCPVTDDIERRVRMVRARLLVTTYTVLDSDKLPMEQLPRDFHFGPSFEDLSAASAK